MKMALKKICICLFFVTAGFAHAAAPELPLQSHVETSNAPLTTEMVWAIAPDELNPHRTRWVLERHLELSGLQAIADKESYVPQVDSLYSRSTEYLRGAEDPIWSDIKEFPCTAAEQSTFATRSGAHLALDRAAKLWDELVSREIFKLTVVLRHTRGEFGENAIKDSNAALAKWSDVLEVEWREKILPSVRAEEWKSYETEARKAGVCGGGSGPRRAKRWRDVMEKPAVSGKTPIPIARAPAKRWGGLFSVLVSMKVGGKVLVGKFLIDSSAPQSVISPTFLTSQGAAASWIEIPKSKPTRILWSGGSGLANPAYVGEVRISGLAIPIHQFFIHETDFFGPPESFGACCDGILGADFLRQYAVEFRPGKTAEVNLFSREGFHGPEKTPWVEVSFSPKKEIISDCTAEARSTEHEVITGGLKWDTGSEAALEFNKATPLAHKPNLLWMLNCQSVRMGENVEITPKEQGMTDTVPLDAGMELMARDQFFMDLGHGRIWFNPQGLALPIVQNHSGLNLEFTFRDGDRQLHVLGIHHGSAAEELRKAGLKEGMVVLSLDSKSVDDMDTWEVEQRLSGVYGETLSVEWKTGKKTSKIAPLKLPPMSP